MEITTWAQEYFQKTLSVNTIHRAIRRCRLKGKGGEREREVVCGQVWWPILGICPLHLTHPSAHSQQWTHTRSSGQPYCGARGAVGGSVPCSRVSPQSWYWRWREHLLFTPPTDNPCRTWESNLQPLGYKSNSLTIRPRLPHKLYRSKLYRSKKKPYLNMIQKRRRFLWAKAHLKWTVAKWKTVLWSDESKFEVLFGKLGRHVIRTKEDKDNPSCYQRSVQKPASLMVWGCMSACGMGSLHIWKGTINAERYIQVLEQHMLPSRCRLFQGRPCIFQHDNARPHTASITTSWLRRRRIQVLKWPACSPDLSPIENIWRIIKRKMRQRRPKTVEQLEACIRQEWDNIPIPKLEQLVSSVPRRLQTVIKRRGDATQW